MRLQAVALALLLLPCLASAHGKYPSVTAVVAHPSDANTLALRTNFGVVVSRDGGKTWRWICEEAANTVADSQPSLAFAGTGQLAAASSNGLAMSDAALCEWTPVAQPAYAGTRRVAAVVRDPSNAQRLLALARDDATQWRLIASTDAGKAWAPLGKPLPAGIFVQSLAIATTGRVYVTARAGLNAFDQLFLHTDSAGQVWQALPFAPTQTDESGVALPANQTLVVAAYVAEIDASDANRLYLRVERAQTDQIWQTSDGGQTWLKRFEGQGRLPGVALSPDGSQLAVADAFTPGGVWLAPSAGGPFVRTGSTAVRCLTWTASGLYGCGAEEVDGFSVGVSHDKGAHFVGLYRRKETQPLKCPTQTTTGGVCPAAWFPTGTTLGIVTDPTLVAVPPPPAATSGCVARPVAHHMAEVVLAALGGLIWTGRSRRRATP